MLWPLRINLTLSTERHVISFCYDVKICYQTRTYRQTCENELGGIFSKRKKTTPTDVYREIDILILGLNYLIPRRYPNDGQACSCPNTICYWLTKQYINDPNNTPISWNKRTDERSNPRRTLFSLRNAAAPGQVIESPIWQRMRNKRQTKQRKGEFLL